MLFANAPVIEAHVDNRMLSMEAHEMKVVTALRAVEHRVSHLESSTEVTLKRFEKRLNQLEGRLHERDVPVESRSLIPQHPLAF